MMNSAEANGNILFNQDPPLSQCPEPIAIVGMGKFKCCDTFQTGC